MADRELAVEAVQGLFGKDLRDEPHVADDSEATLVGHGDPGRLLAAVLEREEPEVGDARHVTLRCPDPEQAAHLDLADLLREIGHVVAGEDEPNRVRFGDVQIRLDPGPFGHLPEGRREPSVGDVVDERKPRSRAPNEPDQLGLARQVDFSK